MSRVADDAEDFFSEGEDEEEPLDVLLMTEDAEVADRVFSQDLLEGSFGHAEFERCTFRQVSFAGTYWARANFDHCTFLSCDFSGAHMATSFLRDCRFSDCRLTGADIHGSYLERVSFKSCLLGYASLAESKLQRVSFDGSSLQEASLDHMKAKGLTFEDADLTRAELFGTSFRGCDLSTSVIDGVRISEGLAELKGASVSFDQAPTLLAALGVRIKGL
jgi:uncharacterized protein YjbI with pentapeptide repeats